MMSAMFLVSNRPPTEEIIFCKDFKEILKYRRRSIRLSLKFLKKNVWPKKYFSTKRNCGTMSHLRWKKIRYQSNWTCGDEIYFRHSVQHWYNFLQKQRIILIKHILWQTLRPILGIDLSYLIIMQGVDEITVRSYAKQINNLSLVWDDIIPCMG